MANDLPKESQISVPPFFFYDSEVTRGSIYKHHPGWDRAILKWCLKDAKEKQLKPQDYMGGFVPDETKVQVTEEFTLTISKFCTHQLSRFGLSSNVDLTVHSL